MPEEAKMGENTRMPEDTGIVKNIRMPENTGIVKNTRMPENAGRAEGDNLPDESVNQKKQEPKQEFLDLWTVCFGRCIRQNRCRWKMTGKSKRQLYRKNQVKQKK